MKTLADVLAEDRRLVILRCLNEATGLHLNEKMIRKAIEFIGHQVAQDIVRGDIVWLEQNGLVRVEKLGMMSGELWLVHLTSRGDDVAQGRAYPGVARPEPA